MNSKSFCIFFVCVAAFLHGEANSFNWNTEKDKSYGANYIVKALEMNCSTS